VHKQKAWPILKRESSQVIEQCEEHGEITWLRMPACDWIHRPLIRENGGEDMSNHRKWSWMAFVAVLFMPLPASAITWYYAWSASRDYVSEEYPPVTCVRTGDLLAGILCAGSYCDNIYGICENLSYAYKVYDRIWLNYVSEESSAFTANCGSGFITGFACRGSYCDNVSVECSYLNEVVPSSTDCILTPSISEEWDNYFFPEGMYAVALDCDGSYCDNIEFIVCSLEPRPQ
jgi:hypothetical protein